MPVSSEIGHAPMFERLISIACEHAEHATAADPGAYEVALLDWLACAGGGWERPATRAARSGGGGEVERIVALGTAGHVLDFDDTFRPGVAHLSAPTAPAALALGADLDCSVHQVLEAYSVGFEAMGSMSAGCGTRLYARGWHPTAVCGVVGAAVVAGRLLELEVERQRSAIALGLLGAGGLLAAFGSDGKALQVGMAAGTGMLAARLAQHGATASFDRIAGSDGFEAAFDAPLEIADGELAIRRNWLKPWPCCLQTHPSISAAIEARSAAGGLHGQATVKVPPFAREAASYDDVSTGLEAKFSIPYVIALTLLRGPPSVASFEVIDDEARALAAEQINVDTDPALGDSEAILLFDGEPVARVEAPIGSPGRPMDRNALWSKIHGLVGDRLDGALRPERPARSLLVALGLS